MVAQLTLEGGGGKIHGSVDCAMVMRLISQVVPCDQEYGGHNVIAGWVTQAHHGLTMTVMVITAMVMTKSKYKATIQSVYQHNKKYQIIIKIIGNLVK